MPEITAQNIKIIFDHFYVADANTWESFTSKLQERHFKKNEIIKDYDTTEKYLNILISGTAGLFIWNGRQDICINLFYENDFFGDYLSFLKQAQKPLKTVALEDIVVWSISYAALKVLYDSSMLGSTMARIVAETLYAKKQEEQINLLTLTAEERYIKLIKARPQIVQRTSLKFIASYLGVTSESLSRIRKRVASRQRT